MLSQKLEQTMESLILDIKIYNDMTDYIKLLPLKF